MTNPSFMIGDDGCLHIEWVSGGRTLYLTLEKDGTFDGYYQSVNGDEWETTARPAPVPVVPRASADELRPYIGKWVAVRDGKVIDSDDSATELVVRLQVNHQNAHSMFRVPVDPTQD